ncbi:MAG: hypothetical protein R3D55_14455 [Chloroflexota bacterium]
MRRLEQEGQPSPYEIVVKPVAETAVATVRTTVPHVHEMGHYCELLTGQVYAGLKKGGIRPLQPEIILYHADEYKEDDLRWKRPLPSIPNISAMHPSTRKSASASSCA